MAKDTPSDPVVDLGEIIGIDLLKPGPGKEAAKQALQEIADQQAEKKVGIARQKIEKALELATSLKKLKSEHGKKVAKIEKELVAINKGIRALLQGRPDEANDKGKDEGKDKDGGE